MAVKSKIKVLDGGRFLIKNARLTFPNLWKPAEIDGEPTKYGAGFLISKESEDVYDTLMEEIKSHAEKIELKRIKTGDGANCCLKDGDVIFEDKEYDGYEDHWVISANNKNRPKVFDNDAEKTPLVPEDGKPYSGCYVDVIISLWGQDNNYGKKVNANLLAVRFYQDGEPLGGGATASEDDFDDEDYDDEF